VLEGWPQACVSVLERPQAAPAARFSGGAARRWFSLAASRLSFAPAC